MSDAAEKPAAAAPTGSKKLLLIVLIFNVVIAGGLGYLVLAGQRGHASEKPKHGADDAAAPHEGEEAEAEGKGEKLAAGQFGPLVEVGSFVANLAHEGPGAGRYAKVTVHVEAANEAAKVRLELVLVPIRSEALMFFSNAKPEDMIGQDKIKLLSDELLKRLSVMVGKNTVRHVYFSELVVQ